MAPARGSLLRRLAVPIFALLGVFFGTTAHAGAITYVSNLAESADAGRLNISSRISASAFLTDTALYELDSVSVLLSGTAGSASISLFTDESGGPGALLENLGSAVLTGGGREIVTVGSTGSNLSPDTVYWLVLGPASSGFPLWEATFSDLDSSPGSWQIGNVSLQSIDGGVTYDPMADGRVGLFSVQAILVPEPSTGLLLAAALAGLAVGRRTR